MNTDNQPTSKIISTQFLGETAEQQAEKFLIKRGLMTWVRNYRCKLGEIDLIMRQQSPQGMTLVFVEVRLRTNKRFAPAIETVDYYKQKKIIRAATRFLQEHKLYDKVACRFDVITLEKTQLIDKESIKWIQNAFNAF
jgi:putative endonuclease